MIPSQPLMPFTIGDTLWLARHNPHQVTITCPVCAGTLGIIVEFGSGERVGYACEACGKGHDGPMGTLTEWIYEPKVEPFTIAGLESMWQGRWRVLSTTGAVEDFDKLWPTEVEALKQSEKQCLAQEEDNMRRRQYRKKGAANAAWSIRYHRNCIKDLERQLAWHQGKMVKK